jgi:ArsR family transcriptional regulator
MKENFSDQAKTLRLLGNPTRLRIVRELAAGSCCVKTLCENLQLPQATVSQHLARLRRSEIVAAARQGAQVCYSLTDPRAARILAALHISGNGRRKNERS